MSCGLVARFKTQVFLLWLQVSDMFVLTHKTYNCCLPGHWCSFSQMSALPESNVLSYKMETHACLMKASGQNPHWGPCCQIEHTTHWCNIQHIWAPLDMSDLSVTIVTMVSKKELFEQKEIMTWCDNTTAFTTPNWSRRIRFECDQCDNDFKELKKAAAPALRHKPELLLAPHSSSERRTQCDI